ncbi:MAG: N-acetylmuramoyl-L-alanine amidase [Deltaproteobacteria bacterium]|nr:N-acetylmuramoyl-L-alanine amidase [Deltaproteobacteria bacterium]
MRAVPGLLCALACLPGCEAPPAPKAPAPQAEPAPKAAPRALPEPAPPAWPAEGSKLSPPEAVFTPGFGVHTVFLDAGHGSPGNPGNTSCLGIEEQAYNLAMVEHLAPMLRETGRFALCLSRTATPGPDYRARLAAAEAFGAEVIVSIHSDVRGQGQPCPVPDAAKPPAARIGSSGKEAKRAEAERPHGREHSADEADAAQESRSALRMCNPDAPGFAVLCSDEGGEELARTRRELAQAVASSLARTGFLPYDGVDYEDLYALDPQTPGVFIDRHRPGRRILFLREPRIPSIIIETHHAWDPREERRFQDRATRDAFGEALAAGLAAYLAGQAERKAEP